MGKKIYVSDNDIKKLFRRLGVLFISGSRFSEQMHQFTGRSPLESRYYLDNRAEFLSLALEYGESLKSGRTAPLSIQQINRKIGFGLFADEDLPAGALIGEYAGVISPAREALPVKNRKGHFASDYSWDYPSLFDGCPPLEVDAAKEGNLLRFVNHSFQPNCAADHTVIEEKWIVFFKTVTPVKKHEQLTVDYGEAYWSGGYRTLYLL